ncbi:DUF2961 domain-containing protein [Kribbella pittospori]|uniref:DUF2961 domain-containing protein n=1 Tax=Kribbella pittospori TaxID=722689 RepID=A0A4R0JEN4_9ACTN|nr:glycoside hydrolase family 172 protein [Kribbella pittospori]TCC45383.1 DUF2961 domain-containing protein [Kribbella pittospori]
MSLPMTTTHPLQALQAGHLLRPVRASSRRSSSWDRTGANHDWVSVGAGETVTLLEHDGPGCITHFYAAMIMPRITDYRDAIVRCYWEGSSVPSVEVPLGDFFGLSHARIRQFSSQMMAVNPGYGPSHGLNCYFPMPFAEHALITLENRGTETLGGPHGALWFHVDYDVYAEPLPDETLHFHAQFRQELTTEAIGDTPNQTLHDAVNLTGEHNYVALETEGRGHMVGLHLQVHNKGGGWYGEGDDMVFIDDATWPPSIHGTGTEEIFGGGACPNVEYASAYTGFHMIESPDFSGLTGMYRWYVHDPLRFERNIRWTIEHGHANNFANGYASVAYWYQDPIATRQPTLPSRADLLPPLDDRHQDLYERMIATARRARENGDSLGLLRFDELGSAFYRGEWDKTEHLLGTFA